jgi:hypothetical protein
MGLIFGLLNCASVIVDYLDYEILSFCSDPFRSNLGKSYPLVCDRHFTLFGLRVRMLKLNKIVIRIKFYHKLPGQHVWQDHPDLELKSVRFLWNHYITVVTL